MLNGIALSFIDKTKQYVQQSLKSHTRILFQWPLTQTSNVNLLSISLREEDCVIGPTLLIFTRANLVSNDQMHVILIYCLFTTCKILPDMLTVISNCLIA